MNKIYCATYSLTTSPGSPSAYRYVYVVASNLQETLELLDNDSPNEDPASISEVTNGAKVLLYQEEDLPF